jgi:tetratricopeptide (TPR) repeat protein
MPELAEIQAWEPLGASSPEAVRMMDEEARLKAELLDGPLESDEVLELGELYARAELADRARHLLAPLLDVVPDESDVFTYLAMTFLSAGELVEGELLAREAVRLNGRSAEAFALLGQVLIQAGRDEEALLPLTQANQLNPRLLVPSLELARLLEESGADDRAARVLEGIARNFPYEPRAVFRLERIRRRQGRDLEADELAARHARTIEIDDLSLTKMQLPPGGVEILLGRHYFQTGRYEQALDELADGRRKRPSSDFDVLALALTADSHLKLGHLDRAREFLAQLQQRYPDHTLTADIEKLLSGAEDPADAGSSAAGESGEG